MERRLRTAGTPTPTFFAANKSSTDGNLPPASSSYFNSKLPAATLAPAPSSAHLIGDITECRSSAPEQAGDSAATSLNVFLNETFAGSPGAKQGVGKGAVDAGCVDGDRGVRDAAPGGGYMLGEIDAPLRHLIKAKERELHEIHDFRIRSLEGLLEEREVALADAFARYDKLKEDFKFNLGLIEDRDAELGRYEATLKGLQECLRDKEVEASELKMRLDEALSVHRQSAARENEQQSYWQAKCKALRDEMDGLRWAREEESRAVRERSEVARAALTRQLREREEELEQQRADSAEAFDRIMQQRQEETQAREAELISQLREADARSSDQARRREKAEREATELRETSVKLRQSLEKAEKVSRGLRWELEDRRKLAAAEREEASKKMEELEKKQEAALCAREDRLREVLGSLHAVEQAFVQHKERHELEEQAFRRREEELRADKEACCQRVQQLEEVMSQGGRREEDLRKAVRAARDDHGREATALRKQLAEKEALLGRDIRRAEGVAAELRDANLSLEGAVRALEEKEGGLRADLQEEMEERKRVVHQLEQSRRAAEEEVLQLRRQASILREEARTAARELEQSREKLQEQEKATSAERRDFVGRIEGLQKALAASNSSQPNGRASPLFSGDQGAPSPLPLPLPPPPPAAGKDNRAEEQMELRMANLRLRGVVADMRREMEALRDPGMRGDGEARERRLAEENEELRSDLSNMRRKRRELDRDQSPALVELEDELSRLQTRCLGLENEVERLVAERDKLMDIGNGLRAELNRALSNSFQREGVAGGLEPSSNSKHTKKSQDDEEVVTAKMREAVARAQSETRRKYRSRVSEVEAAFAELGAENRRLKARVGELLEEVGSGPLPPPDVCSSATTTSTTGTAREYVGGGNSFFVPSGPPAPMTLAAATTIATSESSTSHRRNTGPLRDNESLGYTGNNRGRSSSSSTAAAAGGGAKLSARPLPLSRSRSRSHQHDPRDSALDEQRLGGERDRRSQSRSQRTPGDYDREGRNRTRAEGQGTGVRSTRGDYDAEHDNNYCDDYGNGDSPGGLIVRGGVCADGDRRRRATMGGGSSAGCSSGNVSARQTEGQRAAAERLRAWQERRRRVEGGDGGETGRKKKSREVRGVRNYNIREDSADVER